VIASAGLFTEIAQFKGLPIQGTVHWCHTCLWTLACRWLVRTW
jgi:hypothetical protein